MFGEINGSRRLVEVTWHDWSQRQTAGSTWSRLEMSIEPVIGPVSKYKIFIPDLLLSLF